MSPSVTLSAAHSRLCPMCNFEPCRKHECMFFARYNADEWECIILGTHFNATLAYANAAWVRLIQRPDPFLTAATLRPEALKEIVDGTNRAIDALEALQDIPCNLREVESGIAQMLGTLQKHKEYVLAAEGHGNNLQSPHRRKKKS